MLPNISSVTSATPQQLKSCGRPAWIGGPEPTFPGFPVVVERRIARSGVLGNGKRAPHPQAVVETAG
jgi:hypothetical protein